MFEFIRNRSKTLMIVLVLLIVPSFILLGVDGSTRLTEKSVVVATVDGLDIKQSEWDAAHNSELQRLRASVPGFDPKLLDSPEAKYATLERLVRERVLAVAASKSNLVTSDQRLARDLQQNPSIAGLRRADGTLDMERYKQLVGSQGMTPEMFEARVRSDLSVQQVVQGISASGFSPGSVADIALAAFHEKREVRVARFNSADYLGKVNLTEADIEKFYQDNARLFQAPEQASIEYVVLDLEAVKASLTVSAQDVKTYYEQNTARLTGNEERRASHILLAAGKDAPAAERDKARLRATELLAELRKNPARFAELANQNSQDSGSASSGGDLDFFGRGAMAKPFEDAAFGLKKGEISDVVASDFGFHIIQLTDIKAPKTRTFEELKPEIEVQLRQQLAGSKFAETAETFTNSVFEQPDSLQPVADKLKLPLKRANNVGRQPLPGGTGALANANFLGALFAPDAIEKKRNTEAIELAPNQLVAGRVTAYTPARTRPLTEVREQVRERLLAFRAQELAQRDGEAKLLVWLKNPASAALPETLQVSRDKAQTVSPALINAALRAAPDKLPQLLGVALGAQGYAVVSVDKRLSPTPVETGVGKRDQAQYASWWTSAEMQAYYKTLQERYKVKIKVPAPATNSGENAG